MRSALDISLGSCSVSGCLTPFGIYTLFGMSHLLPCRCDTHHLFHSTAAKRIQSFTSVGGNAARRVRQCFAEPWGSFLFALSRLLLFSCLSMFAQMPAQALNTTASFAAAYQIGRTEAGAASNLLTAVSESTRDQLKELVRWGFSFTPFEFSLTMRVLGVLPSCDSCAFNFLPGSSVNLDFCCTMGLQRACLTWPTTGAPGSFTSGKNNCPIHRRWSIFCSEGCDRTLRSWTSKCVSPGIKHRSTLSKHWWLVWGWARRPFIRLHLHGFFRKGFVYVCVGMRWAS